MTEPTEFQRAMELHTTGRLAEAATLYHAVLNANPGDPDALHQLGVLATQAGRPEVAVDLISRALARRPADPIFLANFGEALRRMNRCHEAVIALRQALSELPHVAELHNNLGISLEALQDYAGARASLEQAVALRPDYVEAHYNLATLLLTAMAEPAGALAHFDRVLALRPNDAGALTNRGKALLALGRTTAAEASFAAAATLRPDDAAAHTNHGVALQALGQIEAAIGLFEHALTLKPDHVDALANLGNALQALGQVEPAIAFYRRALAAAPDDVPILGNLGNALLLQGDTSAAAAAFDRGLAVQPNNVVLRNSRGKLLAERGLTAAARADFEAALARAPGNHEIRSNLLCVLNYDPTVSDAELAAAHRTFAAALPASTPHPRDREPERRARDLERPLRVGYVSADLGRHPVGWFLLPVLAAHDPARVVATCYSGRVVEDELTAQLRGAAAGWRSTIGLTDGELEALIRADRIDVLIDLAGHTAGNRLPMFARRPAPVQVSWLGYFNTTGLPAIDAVLVDAATVPVGAEAGFTETVVRLPTGRLCYRAPDYAPPVAPPPSTRGGGVTFGSFNNLAKLTPAVIALWSAVLRAVPEARLILKWRSLADSDERARLHAAFTTHGVAADRLVLRGQSAHDAMLAEYADVDIALDPFPFGGGLTSCEALWMGVPVVTLPGTRPVSRQTLSLLTQLGLTELAARDADDYVAIATRLAADGAGRAALRTGLRDRFAAAPLGDGPRFARALEDALRNLWRLG